MLQNTIDQYDTSFATERFSSMAPVINTIVKGIVMANDRKIWVEHGMSLRYEWGRNVLYSMKIEGKKISLLIRT